MKIICTFLSILALLVGSQSVIAQSSDENYVMVQKHTSTSNSVDEYRYYDGLGRLVEKVSVNLSPESGVDLLESTSYDAFGHILQKGKPIALPGNSGNYTYITRDHYISDYHEPYAYMEYSYENSPLGRKTWECGPGAAWIMQGKSSGISYLSNSTKAHLSCLSFELSNDMLSNKSYYPDGTLNVIKRTDEDGRVTYEFKDFLDRLILNRRVQGKTDADTYYIYDSKGDLAVVLPPEASSRLSSPGNYSCKSAAPLLDYAYLYTYDEFHRCITKKLPEADAVTLQYDSMDRPIFMQSGVRKASGYNVREWPTDITSTNFRESLSYYDGKNREFGGNISAMTWSANDESLKRKYDFSYDRLSRLTSASYSEDNSTNAHYDTRYTYDLMGNMLTLKRNGLQDGETYGLIDDVSFTYKGNQILNAEDKVEDPTYKDAWNFVDGASENIEYGYDKNGNLVKDLNKGILQITYNSLNLPTSLKMEGGKSVSYVYDAQGQKLQASYVTTMPSSSMTLDYCDNMIYENGKLTQILVDGGYISFTNSEPVYHYYLKDHLGSNRVVVNQATGEVEQVNHYYPFGGLMAESTGGNGQRYKYNGKELDRMHGLDWYDYGARWYDGMRFLTQDPHATDYVGISPYAYCANNPIKAIDPDGKDEWEINSSGYVVKRIENRNQDAFYMVVKDDSGNYERTDKSIAFEYGTILDLQKATTKNGEQVQIFKVNGDNNSTSLFEFFAENTNVEWSHMKFFQQGKLDGINTVSTSYLKSSDASAGYIKDHMPSYGYLKSFIHNHPSNKAVPSGLENNNSDGDMLLLHNMIYEAVKNGSIYPSSYIYTSRPKKYTKYSLTSKASDFDVLDCTLEDVVIKP